MPLAIENLKYNPFIPVEGQVSAESAKYNQGQLIDALMKRANNQIPNNTFREATDLEVNQGLDVELEGKGSAEGRKVPAYLGADSTQAVTEQEAFDYWRNLNEDETGTWADPSRFEGLSKIQLAEIRENDPEGFKAAYDRYRKFIIGRAAKPTISPDFRSEDKLKTTEGNIQIFGQQMERKGVPNILAPLRTSLEKDEMASKGWANEKQELKENNRLGLVKVTNDMEKHSIDTSTGSVLSKSAEDGTNRSVIDVIRDDFGVSKRGPNAKLGNYLSSLSTLAVSTFTDFINLHGHNKQATAKYFGISDPKTLEPDAPTGKKKFGSIISSLASRAKKGEGKSAKAVKSISKAESLSNLQLGVDSLENSQQPILLGMLTTLDKFIRENLHGKDSPDRRGSDTLKGAGNLLRYWTEEGHLSWGRTKKGFIIPIVSSSTGLANISKSELATAFDPSLRSEQYSAANDSSFPLINTDIEYDNINWRDILDPGKDFEGKSPISSAMLNMLQRNKYRLNKDRTMLKKLMIQHVKETWDAENVNSPGSSSGIASTLGEISKAHGEVYNYKDTEAENNATDIIERPKAQELIEAHWSTIQKNFTALENKMLEQESTGQSYYLNWYKSGNTGRYFIMSKLFNSINDKGLVRPLLNLGELKPTPVTNEFSKSPSEIRKVGKEVFNPGFIGLLFGDNINKRLHKLGEEQRSTLGFYYALGKTAKQYGIIDHKGKIRKPMDAIEIGLKVMESGIAPGVGKRIRQFISGERKFNPNDFSQIEQELFLNNKGEWGFGASVLLDADRYKRALDSDLKSFKFEFIFGEDANQSNAGLITTLIGDFSTGGLLGLLPSLAKEIRDTVTGALRKPDDLRDMLTANIQEVVGNTLNAEGESEKAQALSKYFLDVMKNRGKAGKKIITRGLQIAGLYGKYPGYMYTEAADMLLQTPNETSVLNKAYQNLPDKPGVVDAESLVQDIAQVYLMMANEHMAELMGYQKLMKSIQTVNASLNGPTEIEGIFPGENVQLGTKELYGIAANKIMIDEEVSKVTDKVAGWNFKQLQPRILSSASSQEVVAQRALAARKQQLEALGITDPKQAQNIPPLALGEPGTEGFFEPTSQAIRAFPVSIIQNMDSLHLALTWLAANGDRAIPPGATPVHDAIISTADSVLLLNNAYNNIAPHVFARAGAPFFERIYMSLYGDTIGPILEARDDAVFRIGTDPVVQPPRQEVVSSAINPDTGQVETITETVLGDPVNLSGVTAYFDRIYNQLKTEFYTPDQAKRTKIVNNKKITNPNTGKPYTLAEWSAEIREADTKFLAIAVKHGYKDPDTLGSRGTYSVKGKQMKALVVLMLEREGLLVEDLALEIKNDYNLYNVSELPEDKMFRSYRNGAKFLKYQENSAKAAREWAKQNEYNQFLD